MGVTNKRQHAKDLALLSKAFGPTDGAFEDLDLYLTNGDHEYDVLPFEDANNLIQCCGVLEIGGFAGDFPLGKNGKHYDAAFRVYLASRNEGIVVASTNHKQPAVATFLKRHGFTGVSAHNPNSGNNITVWTKVLNKPKRLKKV